MSVATRTLTGLLCGCLLLTSVGCATFHLPFGQDRMQKATARNPVVQIICIWQPSEGRDPSGRPCRGFAGQILFLANRGSLPVQVDGDVRIYLFDDQGATEEQTKPLHQFDFDSATWAPHLTKGTLGPTYSVFVPYMRLGTNEAKCALRVRLKADDQPAVFSDMATIPLDGRTKKTSDTEDQLPTVEEAQAALDTVSKTMRRTTTISMNGETSKPHAKSNLVQTAALSVRADEAVGRVQLANFEEGSEPSDPSSQRIEQLEQLVQQLLDNQHGATEERTKPATRRVQQASASAPAADHVVEPAFESNRVRVKRREVELTPPARLTGETTRHPLSDLEEDSPQPIRMNSRPRREAVAEHPLAALDDEMARESQTQPTSFRRETRQSVSTREPAPREAVAPTSRTILATEQPPREVHSWSDPFEPINTNGANNLER